MVFRPISEEDTIVQRQATSSPSTPSLMATAPVKSQPLHNFSLPHLKWGKNQTNNHRVRKPNESSSSIDHHRHHHSRCSASEAESDGGSSHRDQEPKSIAGSIKNGVLGSTCSTSSGRVEQGRLSNLVVRIPKVESGAKNKSGNGNGEGESEEAVVGKPWNLRPRRYLVRTNNESGWVVRNNGETDEIQPKSLRLRGLSETSAENVEKKDKEKRKFSISLAREEIEEDFFVLTGSKLPRRPKKRNRTVQRQLDNCFPGLWLVDVTPDLYNVPELPSKK